MLILSIKTDQPEAEVSLLNNHQQVEHEVWHAHRALAETIHQKIHKLLQNQKRDWHDIEGVVCYEGPGSFTGLRIGLTIANSLASDLNTPIISSGGEAWLKEGIAKLIDGKDDQVALPNYGRDAHITRPRK